MKIAAGNKLDSFLVLANADGGKTVFLNQLIAKILETKKC